MARKLRVLVPLIVALGIMLPGCHLLFPEKMDATVEINSDWTYTIEFIGVLTDYLTRTSRIEKGELSPEEFAGLDDLVESLKSDRRFRSVEYLGDERYAVEFRETGVLQSETDLIAGDSFARILAITPKPENQVLVEGVEFMDEAELAEAVKSLEKAGMGIDWRIRIKTDGEVIAHNAQSTPWLFGLFGAYEWNIDSLDDTMPLMVIKMGQ